MTSTGAGGCAQSHRPVMSRDLQRWETPGDISGTTTDCLEEGMAALALPPAWKRPPGSAGCPETTPRSRSRPRRPASRTHRCLRLRRHVVINETARLRRSRTTTGRSSATQPAAGADFLESRVRPRSGYGENGILLPSCPNLRLSGRQIKAMAAPPARSGRQLMGCWPPMTLSACQLKNRPEFVCDLCFAAPAGTAGLTRSPGAWGFARRPPWQADALGGARFQSETVGDFVS
jgi:hypothetical protein